MLFNSLSDLLLKRICGLSDAVYVFLYSHAANFLIFVLTNK